MVAVPSVLTNKTVMTGLAQSALKSASVFKTAPAALDKMGSVAAAAPKTCASKISVFTADIGTVASSMPTGLASPFYVPAKAVGFR